MVWFLWGHRFIGVADIAAVRFSLPAHLLEPTPNLGMFISMGLCLESRLVGLLTVGNDRILGIHGST